MIVFRSCSKLSGCSELLTDSIYKSLIMFFVERFVLVVLYVCVYCLNGHVWCVV